MPANIFTYTVVTTKGKAVQIMIGMTIHTDLALGEGDLSLLTWTLDGPTAPASFFAFLLRAFAANMQESLELK